MEHPQRAGEITTVDGETDYGDMGMLSSGACTGDVCEPAPNTPFAPYYGMKMTGELGTAGDTMVAAESSAQDSRRTPCSATTGG